MDERVINLAEKLFATHWKNPTLTCNELAVSAIEAAAIFYIEVDKRSNILGPVKDIMTKVKTWVVPHPENTNWAFKDFMNTDSHKNYISKNKPQADEVTAMAIIDGVPFEYKANQYPHWMNVKYVTTYGQVIGCSSKNIEFNETLGEYVCMDEDAVFVTLFNEMYEGPVKGSLVYTDLPF